MSALRGKNVLLGVCGGIAAYKAPALVRSIKEAGADVRVVLTESAEQFVAPMALQVVSENRVGRSLFDPEFEREIGHIELARWADVVLIAPATANTIARVSAGIADDLLSTIVLATTAPVVVAPSMNTQMLVAAPTQDNLATLARRGVRCVDPDEGILACKESGKGRLPDPPVLLEALEDALGRGRLHGMRVVVSAGPTREYFDPVRFLSNPSSGKMGFALASAAADLGAEVVLVTGPSVIPTPRGCCRVDVETAAEMSGAMKDAQGDIVIMAAAVADWRPVSRQENKRKKSDGPWSPTFERTEDILTALAGAEPRATLLIGFAAETENVIENARRKLESKGADAIIANDVSSGGFGTDDNTVTIVAGSDEVTLGPASKVQVARGIFAWVADRVNSDG